jgi:glyoxylase I family protein
MVPGVAVEHLFASIPVAERDSALDYYERLTGRPPDLIPNEHEAAWQLTATSWVYVVADADRAGSGLHTVLVDDLDRFIADLAERGIVAGPVEIVGGSVRQTILIDADGNRLKVGQAPRH